MGGGAKETRLGSASNLEPPLIQWTMDHGPRMGLRQKTLWARLQYLDVCTCRTQCNTLCLTDRQKKLPGMPCGGGESMQARSAMRALQARTDSQLQSRLLEGRQQTRGGDKQTRPCAVGGGGGNSSSKEGWRSKRCKSHSMDEQAEAGRRERSTPDASCKPHARKRPVGPSVLHRFAFFLGASGAAGPMARRQRLGQRGGAGLPKPTRPQFLPTTSIAPARRGTLLCAHCVRRVAESDNVSQHPQGSD